MDTYLIGKLLKTAHCAGARIARISVLLPVLQALYPGMYHHWAGPSSSAPKIA